jgi:hypothetical protein
VTPPFPFAGKDLQMNDLRNPWLNLSRLAVAYNAMAPTAAERLTCAKLRFSEMPQVAQEEILVALKSMAYQLPDLYTVLAVQFQQARIDRPTTSMAGGLPSRAVVTSQPQTAVLD